MSTMVTILSTEDESQQLTVASTALFAEGSQSYLYRYNAAEGKIHRVKATPLRPLSNGQMVIRCEALKAGDCIVTSGVHRLQEGDAVTPLPQTSATNVGGLL